MAAGSLQLATILPYPEENRRDDLGPLDLDRFRGEEVWLKSRISGKVGYWRKGRSVLEIPQPSTTSTLWTRPSPKTGTTRPVMAFPSSVIAFTPLQTCAGFLTWMS